MKAYNFIMGALLASALVLLAGCLGGGASQYTFADDSTGTGNVACSYAIEGASTAINASLGLEDYCNAFKQATAARAKFGDDSKYAGMGRFEIARGIALTGITAQVADTLPTIIQNAVAADEEPKKESAAVTMCDLFADICDGLSSKDIAMGFYQLLHDAVAPESEYPKAVELVSRNMPTVNSLLRGIQSSEQVPVEQRFAIASISMQSSTATFTFSQDCFKLWQNYLLTQLPVLERLINGCATVSDFIQELAVIQIGSASTLQLCPPNPTSDSKAVLLAKGNIYDLGLSTDLYTKPEVVQKAIEVIMAAVGKDPTKIAALSYFEKALAPDAAQFKSIISKAAGGFALPSPTVLSGPLTSSAIAAQLKVLADNKKIEGAGFILILRNSGALRDVITALYANGVWTEEAK